MAVHGIGVARMLGQPATLGVFALVCASCSGQASNAKNDAKSNEPLDSVQVVNLAVAAAKRYASGPFKVYSFVMDSTGTMVRLGPTKPLVLGGGVTVRMDPSGVATVLAVQP